MPQRIQRKRTKGWRMPAGAIYVGRPTMWGNPYLPDPNRPRPDNYQSAVDYYREKLIERLADSPTLAAQLSELRGHDLMCWCPLDLPCHADVLLELANRGDA